MAITNNAKPSAASITNTDKVAVGETWATDPYTWATETRTWQATGQLITNTARVSSNITNTSKPS